MIVNDLTFLFDSDAGDFTLEVKEMYYQIELVGETAALFDWSLDEILLNGRMAFVFTMRADATNITNIVSFIENDNKEITVDGFVYAVVNDPSNYKIDFKMWQNFSEYADIKLRLRRRGLGIDLGEGAYRVLETQSGDLVETDDGLLIEIH